MAPSISRLLLWDWGILLISVHSISIPWVWDSSILYPFSAQFLCTFSLNVFLVFGMVPWPLQFQSLVCGIFCVFELSPAISLNSVPCFWDSSLPYPFLAQSLLLGMTEFLTPLGCIPMYCWGLMSQSLTHFKLKPLSLGFFNPLPFFRSGLCPPQSQYFVFGIVGYLGPFFWFQDGSIPIFSLILGLFNPSASLSSTPWPLLSSIPWFWDCSIPLTSSISMPWFWDCSIFLSLWNSILWPLQSQCLVFGIAQSLLLYELNSSSLEFQGPDPAPGPHLLIQHPSCFINWRWFISWSCFVNKTLMTTWLRDIHGMWAQSRRKMGKISACLAAAHPFFFCWLLWNEDLCCPVREINDPQQLRVLILGIRGTHLNE